ncbi:MAG TPA: response regulator [Thermoanaerobaculia bacterium]|nr:response regulator [Thermoanaerobaculia bacterium]
MTRTVLLVEDERAIAEVVAFALSKAGFHTERAGTLREARARLSRGGVDFVVLDLGLPDGDGLDLCREVRRTSRTPILMLTCRDEEVDRVLGLETGADDYLVKPFSNRELVARVRSILRRSEPGSDAQESPLLAGRLELRPYEHRAFFDGSEVRLTPIEFRLLSALVRSPSRVFTRELLLERVYDGDTFVSDRTIDSHVKGLRKKFSSVARSADPVETVFGVGYRLRPSS